MIWLTITALLIQFSDLQGAVVNFDSPCLERKILDNSVSCQPNGRYAARQCSDKLGVCYCATETGSVIHGTQFNINKNYLCQNVRYDLKIIFHKAGDTASLMGSVSQMADKLVKADRKHARWSVDNVAISDGKHGETVLSGTLVGYNVIQTESMVSRKLRTMLQTAANFKDLNLTKTYDSVHDGQCPATIRNNCYKELEVCLSDSECRTDEICCQTKCGSKCFYVKPDSDSTTASLPTSSTPGFTSDRTTVQISDKLTTKDWSHTSSDSTPEPDGTILLTTQDKPTTKLQTTSDVTTEYATGKTTDASSFTTSELASDKPTTKIIDSDTTESSTTSESVTSELTTKSNTTTTELITSYDLSTTQLTTEDNPTTKFEIEAETTPKVTTESLTSEPTTEGSSNSTTEIPTTGLTTSKESTTNQAPTEESTTGAQELTTEGITTEGVTTEKSITKDLTTVVVSTGKTTTETATTEEETSGLPTNSTNETVKDTTIFVSITESTATFTTSDDITPTTSEGLAKEVTTEALSEKTTQELTKEITTGTQSEKTTEAIRSSTYEIMTISDVLVTGDVDITTTTQIDSGSSEPETSPSTPEGDTATTYPIIEVSNTEQDKTSGVTDPTTPSATTTPSPLTSTQVSSPDTETPINTESSTTEEEMTKQTESSTQSTTEKEIPAESLTTEIPAETLPTEIPAETLTTEIPAETLTTEIPAETLTTEIPAETLTTEIPAETLTTEGLHTPISTDPLSDTFVSSEKLPPTSAETAPPRISTESLRVSTEALTTLSATETTSKTQMIGSLTSLCEEAAKVAAKLQQQPPFCQPDGTFRKQQCNKQKGICWCVDVNTGEEVIGSTRYGSADCDNILQQTTSPSYTTTVPMGDCWRNYTRSLQVQKIDPDTFIPACDSNGLYLQSQCHGSYCWCVDQTTGDEINGTKKPGPISCDVYINGVCPKFARDHNTDGGGCFDKCDNDQNCYGSTKCCQTKCGRDCIYPQYPDDLKRGLCPAPQSLNTIFDGCSVDCNSDQECEGTQKCCFTGCGYSCKAPVFDTSVHCKKINMLYKGKVKDPQAQYSEGDVISLSCNHGYKLQGQSQIKCLSSGQWEYKLPLCKRVTCGVPGSGQFVMVRGSDHWVGGVVTYHCYHGYELVGNKSATCLVSGRWSNEPPTCKRRECPEIAELQYGRVYGTLRTYGNRIGFRCNYGYTLIGSEQRMCLSDGSWSGTDAGCVRGYYPRSKRHKFSGFDGSEETAGSDKCRYEAVDTIDYNGECIDHVKSIQCSCGDPDTVEQTVRIACTKGDKEFVERTIRIGTDCSCCT